MKTMMWIKCAAFAAAVLLSLFSLGLSAPVNSCDSLVKPITVQHEDMLGKWLYIGGSSDIPGSRSLAYLMSSVWLNITATSQSSILNLIQTQRIYGKCSSLTYNVTFENSTMLIEKPFYLKEVYLPTVCPDCLAVYEKIISGADTFTSHLLFSRTKTVPPAAVDMFKRQGECLRMPSVMIIDPDNEICPENITPSEGLSALNSLFKQKMGHRVARLLDTFFDMFYN